MLLLSCGRCSSILLKIGAREMSDILILIISTISSIIITVIVTKHFTDRKIIIFKFNKSKINANNYPFKDLFLFYKENRYSYLEFTKIKVKNIGNKTVSGTDIAENEKLRIASYSSSKFIDIKILESNKANKICIENIEGNYIVKFDFLDANDEFVILIMHQKDSRPHIQGKIKGCKFKINRPYDFYTDIYRSPIIRRRRRKFLRLR